MKNKKGHLSINVLIGIMAILIFLSVAYPLYDSYLGAAKESIIKSDLRDYELAIKSYAMENSKVEIAESEINDYLSDEMKFENGVSKKENPYGEPYKITIKNKEKVIIETEGEETKIIEVDINKM